MTTDRRVFAVFLAAEVSPLDKGTTINTGCGPCSVEQDNTLMLTGGTGQF